MAKCKECGAVSVDNAHLQRHKKVHLRKGYIQASYVDPKNAGFGSFINPDGAVGVITGGLVRKNKKTKK